MEKGERDDRKKWKYKGWTFFKFAKKYKPTTPRFSINPSTKNMNKTVPRHIAMMLPTDSKKKNFLNAVIGKRPDMYRRIKVRWQQIVHPKQCKLNKDAAKSFKY